MSKYCPKCGKQVPETAKHCKYCGQKLRVSAPIKNNPTIFFSSAVKKGIIAFTGSLALILIMWYVADFFDVSDSHVVEEAAVHSGTADTPEPSSEESAALTQVDLTGYLDDISVLAQKTGAHRVQSDFYEVYYETDDQGLGMVSEWESGPVMILWFTDERYSLYDVSPKEKMDEAVKKLAEYDWKYSNTMQLLERGDYVIELFFHSDTDYKNQQISEIVYGNYAHIFTGYVEDSVTGETPIGDLTVNVDYLHIRKGPSLNAEITGSFVNTGDFFEVFETAYSDDYIWYRIGMDIWIASDGTYVTYRAY